MFFTSRHREGGIEPYYTDMPSSWSTPTLAWCAKLYSHWQLFFFQCPLTIFKFKWFLHPWTCSCLHSTWAVWRLRARWQINWLLMLGCRKTLQVIPNCYLLLSDTFGTDRQMHTNLFLIHVAILGEACWWTIHPASKQRSEGEKVRVGDDLILVSVSSERYLVTITTQQYF